MSEPTPTTLPVLLDGPPALAAYLGITLGAAQELVYRRRVPVVKVGARVYLRRTDVDAWVDAHATPAKPEAADQ